MRHGKALQPFGYDNTVFPDDWHDIGHCTQRNQSGIPFERRLLVAHQCRNQLKGHPYSGQLPERIGRIRPLRINDRFRDGLLVVALVMVGNHHPQAERSSVRGFLMGSNAGIDGYNQLHPFRVQAVDCRAVQAVALA